MCSFSVYSFGILSFSMPFVSALSYLRSCACIFWVILVVSSYKVQQL